MVIVYVESNFVLELSLGQEQAEACEQLLELAEQGRIELAVPAFALVEPLWTLKELTARRGRKLKEIRDEFAQMHRNPLFKELGQSVHEELRGLFETCRDEEVAQHARVRGRLLAVATTIPLDARILREADRLNGELDLDHFDAIMLASILTDLAGRSGPSLFLNRNTKDFSAPEIEGVLEAQECALIGNFRSGLARVRARLGA